MDGNPDSPWNPRVPTDISPGGFEELVLEWLRRSADHEHLTITTEHLGIIRGNGGEYRIDVLVTFSALGGAFFAVLVECKHQSRPIEREDVMVLEAKLRDVNAQKGMLFSTSGFQSGAVEFASAKRIATVAVIEGEWVFETRAAGGTPAKPPPWVHFDPHAGIRMSKTKTGLTFHTIELSRLDAIVEWLRETAPADGDG